MNDELDIFEEIEESEEEVTNIGENGYSDSEKKYGVKFSADQFKAFEAKYESNAQILEYFKSIGMPYDGTHGIRQLASTRYQLFTKYTQAAAKYIKLSKEEVIAIREEVIDKVEKRIENINKKIISLKAKGKSTEAMEASKIKAEGSLTIAEGTLNSEIPATTEQQVLTASEFDELSSGFEPGNEIQEFVKTIDLKVLKEKFNNLDKNDLREVIVCAYKTQQFKPTSEPGTKKTNAAKSVVPEDMNDILKDILD